MSVKIHIILKFSPEFFTKNEEVKGNDNNHEVAVEKENVPVVELETPKVEEPKLIEEPKFFKPDPDQMNKMVEIIKRRFQWIDFSNFLGINPEEIATEDLYFISEPSFFIERIFEKILVEENLTFEQFLEKFKHNPIVLNEIKRAIVGIPTSQKETYVDSDSDDDY